MLASFGELYREEVTKEAAALWNQMLTPYSAEQIRAAYRTHLADPERGRYRPVPADIIAAIPASPEKYHTGVADEMAALEKRRAAGEKFYGLADLADEFRKVVGGTDFSTKKGGAKDTT